jgi:hypothetical protein
MCSSCAVRGDRTVESATETEATSLAKSKLECDLKHDRPRAATVRIEIKSTRASKPGHPMVRTAALCAAHARQLREMGLEVVRA